MKLKVRKSFSYLTDYAEICNDQRVNANAVKLGGVIAELRKLPVVHQRVHRNVQLDAVKVTVADSPRKSVYIKIFSEGASAEAQTSNIYCIRSSGNRREQAIKITCR